MKLNNWSIVKSPIGVSLRHIKNGKVNSNGEVCVHVIDGVLRVSVHIDCVDEPVGVMCFSTEDLKPRVPKLKKKKKKTAGKDYIFDPAKHNSKFQPPRSLAAAKRLKASARKSLTTQGE